MSVYTCSKCGGKAKIVRGNYAFKESALDNVVLQGIELVQCSECDNADPIIPHADDLMSMLAFAVVNKPYRLTGNEIRFLRKYVQMTQEQFSRIVRVDKTTLSKWENSDDPVGQQSDLLIRLISVALGGDGLKARMEEAVRRFESIKEKRKKVRFEVNTETREVEYA